MITLLGCEGGLGWVVVREEGGSGGGVLGHGGGGSLGQLRGVGRLHALPQGRLKQHQHRTREYRLNLCLDIIWG